LIPSDRGTEGINLSKFYKTDFDGRPLPKNGKWDIGAIQYSATKPTKTLAGKKLPVLPVKRAKPAVLKPNGNTSCQAG
jgi:hypothetical protein